MKRFALIGIAGYIAPRHMQAIKETKNELVVGMDKSDSVGIIDSYFPRAHFFTEVERFERYIAKQESAGQKLDYLSICTPNYLHDSHIKLALNNHMNAICEKPLVLNPWNLEAMMQKEANSQNQVFSILQLRLHPEIIRLKQKIEANKHKKVYQVKLNYQVRRGNWYAYSWKGNVEKSGGIVSNIGIHLFDVLLYLFGEAKQVSVSQKSDKTIHGNLVLKHANVEWLLSIDYESLSNNQSLRVLSIDNDVFDFSYGFEDLHTMSYQKILMGEGFSLEDTRPAIELTYQIRQQLERGYGKFFFT